MASESKSGEAAAPADPRVVYVQDRLSKAFSGVKADRFAKAFNEPESL